jgi:hypothetical protein
MAERIQLRRTKGWRLPEGTINVARPTRWGNPFVVGKAVTPPIERYSVDPIYVRDAEHAIRLYGRWLSGSANRCADLVPELRGKNLACWCPLDQPCHADVLLEIANRDEP